jgi:hypothetical protein
MAMMDSTGWNSHEDHSLQPSAEDEFQQFLDMGNMSGLADGLQFDFQDFQNAGGASLLSQAARDSLDTPMGGTEQAIMLGRSNAVVSGQMPTMSAATSHAAIPSQLIPAPLQSPADAIVAIDAQIQYLQQQKLQQQQQQIQDQNAYYGNPNHAVPPTPQSLELQANGHPFFSPNHVPQQHASVFDSRYSHLKDQQDVRRQVP